MVLLVLANHRCVIVLVALLGAVAVGRNCDRCGRRRGRVAVAALAGAVRLHLGLPEPVLVLLVDLLLVLLLLAVLLSRR